MHVDPARERGPARGPGHRRLARHLQAGRHLDRGAERRLEHRSGRRHPQLLHRGRRLPLLRVRGRARVPAARPPAARARGRDLRSLRRRDPRHGPVLGVDRRHHRGRRRGAQRRADGPPGGLDSPDRRAGGARRRTGGGAAARGLLRPAGAAAQLARPLRQSAQLLLAHARELPMGTGSATRQRDPRARDLARRHLSREWLPLVLLGRRHPAVPRVPVVRTRRVPPDQDRRRAAPRRHQRRRGRGARRVVVPDDPQHHRHAPHPSGWWRPLLHPAGIDRQHERARATPRTRAAATRRALGGVVTRPRALVAGSAPREAS